jgi:glycosyltransferase involved in cell wall biosynthesis
MKISVIILTKNSQKYLANCLKSLTIFDEVIVLDNGSTDKTIKIANSFKNVRVVEHKFIGFGALKNLAIEETRNSWILSIDSDEILSYELLKNIQKLEFNDENVIYKIERLNHYKEKTIKCCGWYPDKVLRIFNKDHTQFNNLMVHESLIVKENSRIEEVDGFLLHFPFDSIESLIDKMQRYSSLFAEESQKKSTPTKAFFRATFAFFKNYFFQKGFLYGYEGLLISVSNANGVFYKYMKLYEKEKGEEEV